jgi:hypothetical protein
MPETTEPNPFLVHLASQIVIDDLTLAQLLELRSQDFAELPYAVRLDQLIDAVSAMRTTDLMSLLVPGNIVEVFAPAGDMVSRRSDRFPRAKVLVAAALCHVNRELDVRIPPRVAAGKAR